LAQAILAQRAVRRLHSDPRHAVATVVTCGGMGCGASAASKKPVDTAGNVDEEERTLVLYHGTSMSSANAIFASGFHPSDSGELGAGVYFVDLENIDKAKRFAHDEFHRVKGTRRATAHNEPALIHCEVPVRRSLRATTADKVGDWQGRGYDACCVERTSISASTEWCVADPSRIQIIKADDLRGTQCPWGSYCPYETKNNKCPGSPWKGPCPCKIARPAICKRRGCSNPTWNGKPEEYCSRRCRDMRE